MVLIVREMGLLHWLLVLLLLADPTKHRWAIVLLRVVAVELHVLLVLLLVRRIHVLRVHIRPLWLSAA